MRIVFFGSTSDSVIILEALSSLKHTAAGIPIEIAAAVTQPPTPFGRKHIITPTPVETWAKTRNMTVLSFAHEKAKPWLFSNESEVIDAISPIQPDLIVSASFGQKIPWPVLASATHGGMNVHPSLLPRWRGGDPVPWTILAGDSQTGVTVTTLAQQFDQGHLLGQKKISVPHDTLPDPLRTNLFAIGAVFLNDLLKSAKSFSFKGVKQDPDKARYARRFTRQDGYIPWDILQRALTQPDEKCIVWKDSGLLSALRKYTDLKIDVTNLSVFVERMVRALTPWPGVWTVIRSTGAEGSSGEEKRLKILQAHTGEFENHIPELVLDTVQLEGKNPVPWTQFIQSYTVPKGTGQSTT